MPADQCCPGELKCPHDGPCVKLNAGVCCPGEKLCTDFETPSGSACIDEHNCCPDEQPRCSQCYLAHCENGNWGGCKRISGCCRTAQKTCPDDSCVAAGECCPAEKKCADDVCYPKDDCCPEDIPPLCTECYEPVCGDNETGTCRPIPGCCPENYVDCPSLLQWPGYYGGCCPAGHYTQVNGRPFCANTLGPRVYCDSLTGQ